MDKLDKIINKLRERVGSYFSEDASGHNIDHLERTLRNALYLQSKEGGDRIVIGVSAFIHDIHRIMSAELRRPVSPKESLPVVEKFLKDIEISTKQKNGILKAIEHHEEYAFGRSGINVTDIESLILQDADNLDAIGAVGLVRTIKYSIAHDIPDFEPNIPLYQDVYDDTKEDPSTIHHIYNKLLRLGKNMNTKTAKELSKKKIKLMKDFVNMFIQESTCDVEKTQILTD